MKKSRTCQHWKRSLLLLGSLLPAVLSCGTDGSPTATDNQTTGALEVSTVTTGDDRDPDGYTVTVGEEVLALASDDTLVVNDLPGGEHVVEISNTEPNCGVLEPGNPRSVSILAGDTVAVRFDIRCEGRGSLEVTTATVAGGLDENGFQVVMDGGAARTIGTDDTETFTSVATGDRTVELTGLATGCSVSGDNPRTVTLEADETGTASFDVRCGLRNRIVFSSSRGGALEDIWVMGADGSDPEFLVGRDGYDKSPTVSPDGSLVAFASERSSDLRDIWVVEADGSRAVNLTPGGPGSDDAPAFSPDGTRIAFTSNRDGNREIYVMGVDGSGARPLTQNGAVDDDPTWRPDGTQIAFVSNRTGDREIFITSADGSGTPARVTENTRDEYELTWSPDGTRIAFRSTDGMTSDIHKVCVDGRTLPAITEDSAYEIALAWSPDGTRIAFGSNRDGGSNSDIWVIGSDGSDPVQLTDAAATDRHPAWSPQTGSGAIGPSSECLVAGP